MKDKDTLEGLELKVTQRKEEALRKDLNMKLDTITKYHPGTSRDPKTRAQVLKQEKIDVGSWHTNSESSYEVKHNKTLVYHGKRKFEGAYGERVVNKVYVYRPGDWEGTIEKLCLKASQIKKAEEAKEQQKEMEEKRRRIREDFGI